MPISEEEREKEVLRVFEETLNTEGYAFHYAVQRRLSDLFRSGKSDWQHQSDEVPVQVRNATTRIDFVLRRTRSLASAGVSQYYILAECKRANPAYSDWCFTRIPYIPREGYINLDRVRLRDSRINVLPAVHFEGIKDHPPYHVAVEVKSKKPGDRNGTSRGVIEEAVTQILRGTNGFIEFLRDYPSLFEPEVGLFRSITLLPVIFTTAHLWVSDADLGNADLLTGNIEISKSGFRRVPWLLYQYHVSPGIKHTQIPAQEGGWQNSVQDIVQEQYVRTIPIVGADFIENFIKWTQSLDVRDS